jgi:hypothetical protein
MNETQIALLKRLNLDITQLSSRELQTLKQLVDQEVKSLTYVRNKFLAYHVATRVREMRVSEIKVALAPKWNKEGYIK